jgi:hypothetical protein
VGGKGKDRARGVPGDPVARSAKRDRKRLAQAVTSLEAATARRDRAQARVEALEALIEGLSARLATDAELSVAEAAATKGARPDDEWIAGPPGGALPADPAGEQADADVGHAEDAGHAEDERPEG